jgi:hypothetical protein
VNQGGTILKGGSVGSKKEKVIERAQDNISTVTFPASKVHEACGAARTSVGDSGYGR